MNAIKKKYAKAVQKMLCFEARLAVAEMPQNKVELLQERAFREYESRMQIFNLPAEETLTIFSGS